MCTIIFDKIKEDEKEDVLIDVCSESTWGNTYITVPVQKRYFFAWLS